MRVLAFRKRLLSESRKENKNAIRFSKGRVQKLQKNAGRTADTTRQDCRGAGKIKTAEPDGQGQDFKTLQRTGEAASSTETGNPCKPDFKTLSE